MIMKISYNISFKAFLLNVRYFQILKLDETSKFDIQKSLNNNASSIVY